MAESVWKQIDRLLMEHQSTREMVNARKGWRFRGRKPNGDWFARNGRGTKAVEVRAPTSRGLLLAIGDATCEGCGHVVTRRTQMGCGTRGCKCATCQEAPTGLVAEGDASHA
ncbi:hypothetical protein [Myxococcus virescens]|uniref:Uncharacterized protein n=1 Tax=Myxococcus virescens TaxID=83456 RepID=A0A511HNL9_9BACT|nr:hypothetical protein [Myxococcus virescens]GEL75176.1 hypothetical protein MVI01_69600 [Myxococcus virescens]SDD64537.1 hypothetical protein SAMN04488504_102101 [Myxococcus virescens]